MSALNIKCMIQIGEDAERGGGGDMVVYDAGYPVKEKTRENASFNIHK